MATFRYYLQVLKKLSKFIIKSGAVFSHNITYSYFAFACVVSYLGPRLLFLSGAVVWNGDEGHMASVSVITVVTSSKSCQGHSYKLNAS